MITTIEEVKHLLEIAKTTGIICLDIEYEPYRFISVHDEGFELHGCGISVYDGTEIISEYMRGKDLIQHVLDFICENEIELTMHYAQSDILGFLCAGYSFKKDPIIRCTGVAWNLVYDEWDNKDLGLKTLSKKILGHEMVPFEEVGDNLDSCEFENYAKADVTQQMKLFIKVRPLLKELKLEKVYNIINESCLTFAEMMYNGMPFSMKRAEELFNRLCALKDELQYETYKMIGRVDINSPKQLGNRLFKELNYKVPGLETSEKTGEISTGAGNMTKLAFKYPACEAITAYRGCVKGISTYLEPLVEQSVHYNRNRVYDFFLLTSTTGRTRTKMFQLLPNKLGGRIVHNERLKQIFEELKLRDLFEAEEGTKLVVADYSSLEYRTSAISANDKTMIDMYCHYECDSCGKSGNSNTPYHKCPHCGNEEKFTHGKDLHNFMRDISNEQGAGINRSKAKNVSFCTVFNGTAGRLSQMLNLPKNKCKLIQEAIFKRFTGLKSWHKKAEEIVDTTGEVYTKLGRRRKISLKERMKNKKKSEEYWVRKNAVNQIINVQAQADGCLITQLAIQKLRRRLKKEGLWGLNDPSKIRLVCMVHDEIVLQAPDELAEYASECLVWAMETCITSRVPFPAEKNIVQRWSLAKD